MYLSSIFANGINAAHACEHSLHSCKALKRLQRRSASRTFFFLCIGTERGIYVFQTYAKYFLVTSPAMLEWSGYLLTKRTFWPHSKIAKPHASVFLFVARSTLWRRWMWFINSFAFWELCQFCSVIKKICTSSLWTLQPFVVHVKVASLFAFAILEKHIGLNLAHWLQRPSFINSAEGALSMPSLTQNQASRKRALSSGKAPGGLFL